MSTLSIINLTLNEVIKQNESKQQEKLQRRNAPEAISVEKGPKEGRNDATG